MREGLRGLSSSKCRRVVTSETCSNTRNISPFELLINQVTIGKEGRLIIGSHTLSS